MTLQSLQPLIELQSNSSHFFNQFQEKHQAQMQCKAACSKCCQVERSVFESEAALIIEWAKSLNEEQKKELRITLSKNQLLKEEQKNITVKCAFLVNGLCSIYEIRPVICRTQGAVMQFKLQYKTETEIHVDVCPLNFQEKELPNAKEWLDLDRLNALLSIAENFFQKNKENDYNLPKNKENRVELKELKKILIQII